MEKIKKTNIIFNCDCIEGMKKLPDESVDLIVADPPYFKVIGETWDYKLSTLVEYIDWTKKYLKELFRVLRKGGSFYLFGYFRIFLLQSAFGDLFKIFVRRFIVGRNVTGGKRSIADRLALFV